MKRFSLGGKAPRCPLCHEWMVKKFESNRGFFIWACDTPISCRVALRVDDPLIGHWDRAFAQVEAESGKIPCPNPRGCDGRVRYFATSAPFSKVYCPKCGATLAMGEPDRFKKVLH